MIAAIARGIGIGLGAAVPIGQVNVEIARRTLRGGFWPGFAVGAGASTVDVGYAMLSAFGVGAVLARPGVSEVLKYVSVAVLVYLGVQCLRAGFARRMPSTTSATETTEPSGSAAGSSAGDGDDTAPQNRHQNRRQSRSAPSSGAIASPPPIARGRAGYVTGLAMTVFNPITIAFWFLVLPGQAVASHLALVPTAAGVFVGTMSWVVFYAGTLSVVRRFNPGGWMRVADIAGGLTLLAFAVSPFLRSIRVHL